MWGGSALADALDLARSPGLSTHLRQRPLPPDVLTVIRLASDCAETMRAAELSTGQDRGFLLAAADLYIQKVLCFQGADPYRVLGVPPHADRDLMRLHMRNLMKSLHPDRSRSEWRSASAARVMAAWRDVNAAPAVSRDRVSRDRVATDSVARDVSRDRVATKTVARDSARPVVRPSAGARRGSQTPSYKPPWVPRPIMKPKRSSPVARPRRRALRTVVLLAALLSPNVLVSEDTMAPVQRPAGLSEASSAPRLSSDDIRDEGAR